MAPPTICWFGQNTYFGGFYFGSADATQTINWLAALASYLGQSTLPLYRRSLRGVR